MGARWVVRGWTRSAWPMNGYSSSVGAITSGGCASSVCSHLRRLSPPFAHPNPKRVHRGRRRRQRRRRRRRCRRHRRRRRWNVPLAACTVGAHSLSHRRRRPVLHAGHTLCRPACAHVWTAGAAPSATCPSASRGAQKSKSCTSTSIYVRISLPRAASFPLASRSRTSSLAPLY